MIEKAKMAIDEKLLKKSFLYTIIWGIVAHGYCFMNLMVSHDSLNDFYLARQWPKAGFGRFFYAIYITLTRGRIVLPWLIGVFSICWTALAVYLVVRMFDIQKSSIVVLISGICITNPTVYALAATYIHDLDADLFAMLLAVAATFLWNKVYNHNDKKMQGGVISIAALLLSISLGIYQSYISVTITLIILLCIKNLLQGERFSKVLQQGLLGIVMLFFAAVFYLIEAKIFEYFTGSIVLGNQSYNGLGNLSQAMSGDILSQVINTYGSVVFALKNMITTSYPERLFLLSQVILTVCIITIAVWGLRKIEWKGKILLLVLSIIMPFGMNISYFLSKGVGHVLMQYAVWFVYLLAIVLALWFYKEKNITEIIRKAFTIIVATCIFVTIIENVQTANAIYMEKELEYQSTLSYMTRVADKMEEQADYIPGETPVIFIGEDAIGKMRTGFEKYSVITGVSSTAPITFYDTYEAYFEYVLGIPLAISSDESIKNDESVVAMPVFPKQGSITFVDGILVVKLGEN